MTPILFRNIKWLFVEFTFCHRTTVTLDTQWQNARTFLERINLRYTTQHDSTLSLRSSRNQGRCKLLPRNSAAAISSSGHSSEVRRSFRVSTGRCAVSSSEVNCRVPAAYHAEFHRTVCMATEQPGLKSGRLCCLGSYAAERVLHSNFQPARS